MKEVTKTKVIPAIVEDLEKIDKRFVHKKEFRRFRNIVYALTFAIFIAFLVLLYVGGITIKEWMAK